MGDVATKNAGKGGGKEPTGASWSLEWTIGAGLAPVPIVVNTEGTDVSPSSSTTTTGGLSANFGFGFYPYNGPIFAIGARGAMTGAIYLTPGGSGTLLDLDGQARIRLGPDATVSVIGGADIGYQSLASSANTGGGFVDSYSRGSAHYVWQQAGGGLK